MNKSSQWFLFLVSPILGMIVSILRLESKTSRQIVVAFSGFIGLCFLIVDGYIGDAVRYRDGFLNSNGEFSYLSIIGNLYSDSANVEIIEKFITYSVASFSDNYKVLFGVFGLFFGYFLTKSLGLLYDNRTISIVPTVRYLTVVYIFTIPFWFISGFPFWAASHICTLGLYLFFLKSKVKGFLILYLATLLHMSFWLPIIALTIYLVVSKWQKGIIYFFLISIIFSIFELNFINNLILNYSPSLISDTYQGYLITPETKTHSGGRFLTLFGFVFRFIIYYHAVIIWDRLMKTTQSKDVLIQLFGFGFLFAGIINFISIIPSIGRFYSVINLVFLGAMLLTFLTSRIISDSNSLARQIKGSTFVLLSIIVLFSLRSALPIIGVMSLLGNFFTILFVENIDFVVGNVMELF